MLRNDLKRSSDGDMPVEYGIYAWDIAADAFRMDATLCRYIGLDREIGATGIAIQSFASFIHPGDRGGFLDAIGSSARLGSELRQVFRLDVLNGSGGKLRAAGHSFQPNEQASGICTGVMFRVTGGLRVSSEADLTDYCIAAYEFAKQTNSPMVQYLISMALIELGYEIAGLEAGSVQ